MARNFQIVFNDGYWDLRVDGVPRAISRHKSRDEAIRVGTAAAQRLEVALTVEAEDDGDGQARTSALAPA
ncbi:MULTISPECIES: DUF2188 domain-containing protein [unclassified Cupriavidus]|uniref:DUF2188 domain-containing protein n=1 Tax=Cupriavidus sp. H19C3 TaxID=3241603 RepID=UPI0011D77985|nr:MAG: DUF2188 domain-containing protein [Cupriavidus sp.]